MDIDMEKWEQLHNYVAEKYGMDLILSGESLKRDLRENGLDPDNPLLFGCILTAIVATVLHIEQSTAKSDEVVSNLLKNFKMPEF